MRKNWSPYVWKLLWFAGFIALLLIYYHLELKVKSHVATTFYMHPLLWYNAIAAFVLGIYISFLFVNVRMLKWNWPLILCITLPSFIITFYSPIIYTIIINTTSNPNNFTIPIPYWMLQINNHGISSLVAGLTLMIGMFERFGSQK